MAGFARQHEYRIGRALFLAFVVVVVGSWLFPVEWLRFFGRSVEPQEASQPAGTPWVRLIPVESLDLGPDLVLVQTTIEIDDSPEIDESAESQRHEWTFDPTTAWSPATESDEPVAGALPDSVLLRADLMNSLRLANWGAVFAMLDTTQAGRAREQLAETDRWVNRRLGPIWTAQGFARRQSNLWHRVVHEVEAEGSH